MYFTLLFDHNPEGPSLAYDLVFAPCPIWVIPRRFISEGPRGPVVEVVNPDGSSPYYQKGHLKRLLETEGFDVKRMHSSRVNLICHEDGQGTKDDLDLLVADLESEGFLPIIQNAK